MLAHLTFLQRVVDSSTVSTADPPRVTPRVDPLAIPSIQALAAQPADEVLAVLGTRADGLGSAEVAARVATFGPNAVRSHHTSVMSVLVRQVSSPLLWLLLAASVVSAVVGEGADAVIIAVIIAASVGLGFANEYRAERAAEAMHDEIRHLVTVVRDGEPASVEITHLVPGDIVRLGVGAIVPADVRLLAASDLECDESILTGESVPAEKSPRPVEAGAAIADLSSCLFMGTVVHEGSADAVVVATGRFTQFGRIASGLGERHPQTEFQRGLTRFSGLLARVAGVLSVTIFFVNVLLGRSVIEAVLFSLAVAVGITPQLLPAVVSTSLATGSRRLAQKKVLVKRLVCIEDLGDIDVLFTDKTGTLTDGHISFERAMDPSGDNSQDVLRLGLVCNEATVSGGTAVGGNPLDVALWEAPAATAVAIGAVHRQGIAPFDHDRRCVSVLVDERDQRLARHQGRAGDGARARCTDVRRGPTGARARVRSREPCRGRRVPPGTGADCRDGSGRARPAPRGLSDLPRPAEAVGGRLDRPARRPRHHRQDRDRRQPARCRDRLPDPRHGLGGDADRRRPRRARRRHS